jgi:hypothetical protein
MTEGPVHCVWCGASAASLPHTWTLLRSGDRADHLCERCSREQVRTIEAKFDLAEGGW